MFYLNWHQLLYFCCTMSCSWSHLNKSNCTITKIFETDNIDIGIFLFFLYKDRTKNRKQQKQLFYSLISLFHFPHAELQRVNISLWSNISWFLVNYDCRKTMLNNTQLNKKNKRVKVRQNWRLPPFICCIGQMCRGYKYAIRATYIIERENSTIK